MGLGDWNQYTALVVCWIWSTCKGSQNGQSHIADLDVPAVAPTGLEAPNSSRQQVARLDISMNQAEAMQMPHSGNNIGHRRPHSLTRQRLPAYDAGQRNPGMLEHQCECWFRHVRPEATTHIHQLDDVRVTSAAIQHICLGRRVRPGIVAGLDELNRYNAAATKAPSKTATATLATDCEANDPEAFSGEASCCTSPG